MSLAEPFNRSRREWLQMMLAATLPQQALSAVGERPQGTVNPRDFGASGNGSRVDSVALQRCIDSGKPVWVPPGRFVVGNLRLRSGTRIGGAGPSSRLLQVPSARYLLSINPGNEGTTNTADNTRSVTLENLSLNGQVGSTGFREHSHVLNLNACSDVLVESCEILGFRGDGIYLGSGNTGRDERHNQQVTIRNCRFDGLVRNNRNAVSVVDCDGLVVQNCEFRNCTRRDMPGAIDIEPDPAPHHVVQNIRISGNRFERIGGSLAVISLLAAHKHYRVPPRNIVIENNFIQGGHQANGIVLISRGDWSASVTDMHIAVEGNAIVDSVVPFELSGVGGVVFRSNRIIRARRAAEISLPKNGRTGQLLLSENQFDSLSTEGSRGIRIHAGGPIEVSKNRFVRWGARANSASIALDLSAATPELLSIHGNSFFDEEASGRIAIAPPREISSEFDASSNEFSEGLVRLR